MAKIIKVFKEMIIPYVLIPLGFTGLGYFLPDYDKNKTLMFQAITLLCLLVFSFYLMIANVDLEKKVSDIADRSGTSVELLQYGKDEKYKTPFELPIQLIKNAKTEILILDYFPWQSSSTSDPKIGDIDTRYKIYYDELIKAATKSDSIEYHRIIQLPKGTTNPSKILSSLLKIDFVKNHFEKMINLMKTGEPKTRVSIKTCNTTYPTTTFIIVDEKHVIWEVPYLNDAQFKFDLDLYIVDSQGTLAKELKTRFCKLNDNAKPLSSFM